MDYLMDYIFVAFKSLFCYVYLIVLLRLLGKKEFSQLNIFDFVVFLLLADLMAITFESGEGLDHAIIATSVLALVDYICSCISLRSKKLRDILEGTPCYIITRGKINYEKMRELKYTVDSLAQHLRQQGISSVSEVAFAILETNGQLSVIKRKENQVVFPDPVIMDGKIMHDALSHMGYDESWLIKKLKEQGHPGYENIVYCVVEKDRLFFLEE